MAHELLLDFMPHPRLIVFVRRENDEPFCTERKMIHRLILGPGFESS